MDTITLAPDQLSSLIDQVTKQLTAVLAPSAGLPVCYKFPEDIITITGGHIPVGTIRGWKTRGYLRTIKIGRRSFVTHDSWEWFLTYHGELMAAAGDTRSAKINGAG